MTTSNSPTPGHVVIVGGGVAGLEALLALQALAGDRVDLTLVSQHDWFVDRPVTVAEPFGLASAARHSVPDIVAERGARFVGATVVAVHADAHRVSCADGTELSFDTLILAPGARLSAPVADAIAFGLEGSGRAIGEMLDRLRSGGARSVAFVAPSTTGWLLPLYELALMTARELARSNVEGVAAAPPQPGGSASGAVRRPGQPERRSLVGRGGDRVHRLDRGPGRPPITSSRCRSCAARTWPAYRPRRPMASLRSMSMGR